MQRASASHHIEKYITTIKTMSQSTENLRKRKEIFAKIEPYLTFLDYSELEARGADVVTKLQEKDKQIEALTKKQEQFEQLIQSLIDSGQLKSASNNG